MPQPYRPNAHPVQVVRAEDGTWLSFCGGCTAREGAYVAVCQAWPLQDWPPPVLMDRQLHVGEIEQVQRVVADSLDELGRRPEGHRRSSVP